MKGGDSLTIGDETLVLSEVEETVQEASSGITLVNRDSFSLPLLKNKELDYRYVVMPRDL